MTTMRYLLPLVLACAAPAQNLLVNGDFAKGLDGWTVINRPHMLYLDARPGRVHWEHRQFKAKPPVAYTGIAQEIELSRPAPLMRYLFSGANGAADGEGPWEIVLVPLSNQGKTFAGGTYPYTDRYSYQAGGFFENVPAGKWRVEYRAETFTLAISHNVILDDLHLQVATRPLASYESERTGFWAYRSISTRTKHRNSLSVVLFSRRRLPAPAAIPGIEGPGMWLDPAAGIFYVPPVDAKFPFYVILDDIRGYLQVLELCHRCPTPRWALGSFEKVLR